MNTETASMSTRLQPIVRCSMNWPIKCETGMACVAWQWTTQASPNQINNGCFQSQVHRLRRLHVLHAHVQDEVKEYFKYPEESEEYLRREMEEVQLGEAVSEYSRDAVDGFEVDLSKLPEGVKALRFENSY